jgi:hypothetical protein
LAAAEAFAGDRDLYMQTAFGICFTLAPGLILLWASIHSLRIGKFPVFWWIVTIDRGTRPRVFIGLMALMIAATALALYVGVLMVMAMFRGTN